MQPIFKITAAAIAASFILVPTLHGQTTEEPFESIFKRTSGEKPLVMRRQLSLLEQRYDLTNRAMKDGKMFRGKPIQEGVRAKLPQGLSWTSLGNMTPAQIREKDLMPQGFLPLPHPKQAEGGMIFPKFHIDEVKKQTLRDLTRFDLDFDIPDHFLPEFPPPIFLTLRKDLGDVSQGKLVTSYNFY